MSPVKSSELALQELDSSGRELRKKLLEIYDKTVWANDGWYTDDGVKKVYLKELNELLRRSGAD